MSGCSSMMKILITMRKRNSFLQKMDKFWVYSGLFGLSLFLHHLTPYYQNQPEPDFVHSVIGAPLSEEFFFRFLGILIALLSLKKIAKSDSRTFKVAWGMVFTVSVYGEIASIFLSEQNPLPFELTCISLFLAFLFLVLLLVFKEYQLEFIIFASSFIWAFGHETFRFIPVFIVGIFFSLLCVNRSRIALIDNQNKKTIMFLLVYGVLPGYLIHFWNNFLNWSLYQQLNPIFIDLLSLLGVTSCLILLEKYVNQFIDHKCIYRDKLEESLRND